MSAVTYHHTNSTVARPTRKSVFARLLDALYESRMRQAQAEIARHRHLLSRKPQQAERQMIPRTEGDLPFIR